MWKPLAVSITRVWLSSSSHLSKTSIEKVGFRGAAAQPAQTWSATGGSLDRTLTGSDNTQLRNVLQTLINDLEAMGLLA